MKVASACNQCTSLAINISWRANLALLCHFLWKTCCTAMLAHTGPLALWQDNNKSRRGPYLPFSFVFHLIWVTQHLPVDTRMHSTTYADAEYFLVPGKINRPELAERFHCSDEQTGVWVWWLYLCFLLVWLVDKASLLLCTFTATSFYGLTLAATTRNIKSLPPLQPKWT